MDEKRYVAYVATKGENNGIHLYDIDCENGILTKRKVIEASNASHIWVSANGKYLYSILDGGVGVYKILPDGDLEFINKKDINAMRGRFLSTDLSGKYLFIGGYHDGKITVMHTHRDGRLGSIMDSLYHKGIGSVAERNSRPHVTCVIMTPDNKFLCAVDNGIDQVKIYRINDENKLELADILRMKRESAPRVIRFSPDGKTAYILTQITNTIEVYSYKYDEHNNYPTFEKLQSISTLSDELDPMYDAASGLCFCPDGKHLFSSSAGDNTVAMFSINPEDGTLTKEFALPISGEYPKDITVLPGGKYLLSANHESDTITIFKIDYDKKLIMMHGKPISVPAPNCIRIYDLKDATAID
jgi:6-phosphogluconolactonase